MQEPEEKYLKGFYNTLIRYYFYLSTGMGILNDFRNLFLGIFAIYITFKVTSIPFLLGVFISSIIVLTIMGYYTVHYISKVKEFLGVKFGSHFGIKTFDYQKAQFEQLEEIKKLLQDKQL